MKRGKHVEGFGKGDPSTAEGTSFASGPRGPLSDVGGWDWTEVVGESRRTTLHRKGDNSKMRTTINQRRAVQIGISVGGLGTFLVLPHWTALGFSVAITIIAAVIRIGLYEFGEDASSLA